MGIVRLNQTDRRIIISALQQAQDDLGAPDREWKRRVADDLKRIETNLARGLKPATVKVDNGRDDSS